jgi:hypothetical protein
MLVDDFGPEMKQQVLIQNWVSNNGYKDFYSDGTLHYCMVSYETRSITKTDGTAAVTTMQIDLNGDVVVGSRDKVTFGTISPKILRVQPDYDIENPSEVYGITIYT